MRVTIRPENVEPEPERMLSAILGGKGNCGMPTDDSVPFSIPPDRLQP